MKISGIYKIQSKMKPERCYIGSAVNIGERWTRHLSLLQKNKHHSSKLQRHFNKYDESDLQFSILLGCDKEDLIKVEQYFLDSYNPWFNICKKAGNSLGVKRSEETNRKHSIATKGIKRGPQSEERKQKANEIRKNRPKRIISEEVRLKISNTLKGQKHTEERRRKISEIQKGRPQFYTWNGKKHTKEHNKKIALALTGRKRKSLSDEHKKKISISRLGIKPWNKKIA